MRNPELVVALDMRDADAALSMAKSLCKEVPWVKVGLELFVHTGPSVVTRLKDLGFKVFVDLKMYDIPNTVRGGILSAANAGADMLTIHAQGGQRMAEAAMQAAEEAGAANGVTPLIMGVTVLTSMAPGELPTHDGDLGTLAAHLAVSAKAWGLHGIVSSGHEVEAIKAACGKDFLCLTPGIRLPSNLADDQRRVMTPAAAVAAGSDFLVVGRPVTAAESPVEAAKNITSQMKRI